MQRKLGFGAMRLPLTNSDDPKSIDLAQFRQMADLFMEQGFCYFDTHIPTTTVTLRRRSVNVSSSNIPASVFCWRTKCRSIW